MWARQEKGAARHQGEYPLDGGLSARCRTQGGVEWHCCVYVADREADIRERMTAAQQQENVVHWLVRAKHNRVTGDGKLWDRLSVAEVLGTVQFTLARTATRQARPVELTLRRERITLPATQHYPELTVTALLAREEHPPENEPPIEWRLLTDETLATLRDAVLRIEWYRRRWLIELFFRTLKTGCKVEELQLSTKERLEKAIVIYLIIAWRVLMLMTLGRDVPELPCDVVFAQEEWQAAWIVSQKKPLPPNPPTLGDMILIVARFGGFLARKNDGNPGVEALWRGLYNASVTLQKLSMPLPKRMRLNWSSIYG